MRRFGKVASANPYTSDKASAPATWPYLEADAWAVYYEWDRRPLRALVAEKLNAITTLCGVHIGEHEKLDDVNLLHRQCNTGICYIPLQLASQASGCGKNCLSIAAMILRPEFFRPGGLQPWRRR